MLRKHRLTALVLIFLCLSIAVVQGQDSWTVDEAFLEGAIAVVGAPSFPSEPLPVRYLRSPDGVVLTEPDEKTLDAIRRAEQHIAENSWTEAFAAYKELISDDVQHDIQAAPDLYIPAAEYCRRRILASPEISTYRRRYDIDAAKRYAEAVGQGCPEQLADVARFYPLSSVAAQALNESADIFLMDGDFGDASRNYIQALLNIRPGDRLNFSPVIMLLKTAASLKAIGAEIDSEEIIKFAVKSANDAEAERVALLAAHVTGMKPFEPAPPSWGVFGGNNARALFPERIVLPRRLLWYEQIPGSRPQLMDTQPLVVDGSLYYRYKSHLMAMDMLSGEFLWSYKEVPLDNRGRPMGVAGAVFSKMMSGTVDGDRFYAGMFYSYVYEVLQHSRRQYGCVKLMAFGKSADGLELLWQRNHQEDEDPLLANMAFVTAPTVVGDKLYTGAIDVMSRSIYLMALEAATGRVLWKRFICVDRRHIPGFIHSGYGTVEIPSEKDGIIYFATNAGIVAALDGKNGNILWKHAYAMCDIPMHISRSSNPPVVSDGKIFLLPIHGEHLSAVDLQTGLTVWRHPVTLQDNYLLGVKDGHVILSGNNLMSISTDGRLQWVTPQLEGKPFGRGLIAGDLIMCPVSDGIEMIQLDTGEFVGAERPYFSWREWAADHDLPEGVPQSGNLLIAEGKLIITGMNTIMVFE